MLFRRPCYFDDFTCTADKCTDNCCIGWEICIDADTCDYYKSINGPFGERLKNNISNSEEPSFILKDERCPFLNERNLCDIITNLGENALCQICRDHPRWFEWYGNEKEGGIGLSCEEGARLILTEEGFADYFESECDDEPDEDFDQEAYRFLLSVREKIFDIIADNELSFNEKADSILSLSAEAEAKLNGASKRSIYDFDFNAELQYAVPVLAQTEPIGEKWTAELKKLEASSPHLNPDGAESIYLTRLFTYFIWRYFLTSVFDYRVTEKVHFALFSITVIYALFSLDESKDFNTLLKSAVLYSKQMEYCAENLDIFFSQC